VTGQLQAFRYALPATPVAGAAVEIGHVGVTVELRLTGELTVHTAACPADRARAEALTALRHTTKGLMVRGLGSANPSVSAAAGHRFTQRHHDFRAPATVAFAGDCAVDFTGRRDGTATAVRGETRYSLEVTTAGGGADEGARGWFLQHEKELAAIGIVLLVAAPVPPGGLTAR
jgi:hypothetical protein